MRIRRRFRGLAMLLATVLLAGQVNMMSFAGEDGSGTPLQEKPALYSGGDITYMDTTVLKTGGAAVEKTVPSSYVNVNQLRTEWSGSAEENDDSSGFYIVDGEVTMNQRVNVTGHVKLVLCNDAQLTVSKGIAVNSDGGKNSLTIYREKTTEGTSEGKLIAIASTQGDAAIGGKMDNDSGVITICGGEITASFDNPQGVHNAAVIGGGERGSGTVNIYGGKISVSVKTALQASGTGIGAGSSDFNTNKEGNVSVYGGTVDVTMKAGYISGAAIGGGGNSDGTVLIQGGTVHTRMEIDGTDTLINGAGIGIGNGNSDNMAKVTIGGGSVTVELDAKGENNEIRGAGIGSGGNSPADVNIEGGRVQVTAISEDVIYTIGIGAACSPSQVAVKGSAFVDVFLTGPDNRGETILNLSQKGGIIYQRSESEVLDTYTETISGEVTFSEDLVVPNGYTLDIPEGSTLTFENGAKLILGTGASVKGKGTISPDSGKAVPTITVHSVNKTYDKTAVTEADVQYTYTGEARKPAITAKWYQNTKGNTRGDEITAPVENGTYWVGLSAEGTAHCTGAETFYQFTIAQADGALANKQTGGYKTTYTYSGQEIPAPQKENFTYTPDTAALSFEWYEGSYQETATLPAEKKLSGSSRPKNAGEYTLVVNAESNNGNYTDASLRILVKINQMNITVTPESGQGKYYGQADTALTYTTSPAMATEDSLTGSLSRKEGEDVGNYKIGIGTLVDASGNYQVTFSDTTVNYEVRSFTVPTTVRATITGHPNGSWTNHSAELTVTAPDGYLIAQTDSAGLGLNTSANWSTSFTIGSLSEGNNEIYYGLRVKDGKTNGNAIDSSSYSYQLKGDFTKPTVTVSVPTAQLTETGAKVTVSATETGSGADSYYLYYSTASVAGMTAEQVIANLSTVRLESGNYTLSGLSANTTYYLAAVVTDQAGNVSDVRTGSFTTEKSALTGSVALTGTRKYGSTLTAQTTGLPQNTGDLTYSFYRYTEAVGDSGTLVQSSATASYKLGKEDVGRLIEVCVTASNYKNSIVSEKTSAINKADVPILLFPTAGKITYGAALSTSVLTGTNIYGTFAWKNGTLLPTVVNTGYEVVFTPDKDALAVYNIAEETRTVAITVEAKEVSDTMISDIAQQYYTQAEVEPVLEVQDGSQTLHLGTDYEVRYEKNIAVGTNTAKAIITGKGNYKGSAEKTFSIAYAAAPEAILFNGAALQSWYSGDVTVTAEGFKLYDDKTGTYVDRLTVSGEGSHDLQLIFQEKTTGRVTDTTDVTVKIDNTAPEGRITVGAKGWQNALSFVGFDRYQVKEKTFSITTSDAQSGMDNSTQYAIVEGESQFTTVEALKQADLSWNNYTAPIAIAENQKLVVYAKFTDNAGNVSYISSDGIMLDTAAPEITFTQSVAEGANSYQKASFDVAMNETGNYYYVVMPASAKAHPTASDVIATVDSTVSASYGLTGGTAIDGAAAFGQGTREDILVEIASGLLPNTAYQIFYTAIDSELTKVDTAEDVSHKNKTVNVSAVGTASFTTDATPAPQPQIKGEDGTEGWEAISNEIDQAEPGDKVTIDMNGSTVVPADIIESIKGKDVEVVIDLGGGITWTIDGADVTGEIPSDIDFAVEVGTSTIPVDVMNIVTGEHYSIQISLAHEGAFGFTATLTVNMDEKNAGYYANLFYYNKTTRALEFMNAGKIDEDGNVKLVFNHASEYSIVIADSIMDGSDQKTDIKEDETIKKDEETQTEAEITPTGDSTNIWKYVWVLAIGAVVLIVGVGAMIVKKRKDEQ